MRLSRNRAALVVVLGAACVSTAGCDTYCENSSQCKPDEVCLFVEGSCLQPAQLGLCRSRPDSCPATVDVVCGCDGVTYQNGCEAGRGGTSVASHAACRCGGGNQSCQMGEFCQRAGCTANAPGTCVIAAQTCQPDVAVCGCDGKTYMSSCEAAKAQVSIFAANACSGDPLPDMAVPPDLYGVDAGPLKPSMVISQFRTAGAGGYADEFVELYNTTDKTIVLDPTWRMIHSSVQAVDCSGQWIRFVGSGQEIPPHSYWLLGGLTYSQTPQRDQLLLNSTQDYSLGDAGSLVLEKSGQAIDTVCFSYDATTTARLKHPSCTTFPFTCEGEPVSNLPHNGSPGPGFVDASVERLPGGMAGSGQDTNDNSKDFVTRIPSVPRNIASPPAP